MLTTSAIVVFHYLKCTMWCRHTNSLHLRILEHIAHIHPPCYCLLLGQSNRRCWFLRTRNCIVLSEHETFITIFCDRIWFFEFVVISYFHECSVTSYTLAMVEFYHLYWSLFGRCKQSLPVQFLEHGALIHPCYQSLRQLNLRWRFFHQFQGIPSLNESYHQTKHSLEYDSKTVS